MRVQAKGLAGIMVLWLNTAPAGPAPELSSTEVYQRAVKSTLALEVTTLAGEQFVGAAFVVERSELAVTAWHLVQQARRIRGRLSDGTSVEVRPSGVEDEFHDLALLRISPASASPLPLCAGQPAIASRVYAIGSPRGYAFSISDGLLSQVQVIDGFPQYQLSCPFSPGNSGGPVLNSAGEVIGVSSWTKVGAQNLNFAIPAQFVTALCQTKTPSSTGPPTEEFNSQRLTASEAETSGEAAPVDSSFADFRQLLGSLAGHRARVVVSSAALTRTFDFLVPSATASSSPPQPPASPAATADPPQPQNQRPGR